MRDPKKKKAGHKALPSPNSRCLIAAKRPFGGNIPEISAVQIRSLLSNRLDFHESHTDNSNLGQNFPYSYGLSTPVLFNVASVYDANLANGLKPDLKQLPWGQVAGIV